CARLLVVFTTGFDFW
nr:immunoglobulin heavy chain junction region [Macaca mulatta]